MLAWGHRLGISGWPLVDGWVARIGQDGDIALPYWFEAEKGQDTFSNFWASSIGLGIDEVERRFSGGHSFQGLAALERSSAVALVRILSSNDFRSPRFRVHRVRWIRWLVGTGPDFPDSSTIELSDHDYCLGSVYPGDTLILPIPDRTPSGTWRVEGCPSSFHVRCGFIPSLGVDLEHVASVIVLESGHIRLHPRPIGRR